MRGREIKVKSVLTKSKIPGVDYVINPFLGCQHGCVWCYARFMCRFTGHDQDPWGSFVDVKINAPQVLAKELPRVYGSFDTLVYRSKPNVFLSSVTDPYQPLEKKYGITRKILKLLLLYQVPTYILTQSTLVLREIDLFKKFKKLSVGFTIITLDPKISRLFQPGVSLPQEKIAALEKLKSEGIKTSAHIGPILPEITNLEEIFQGLKGKVDDVCGETLNIKGENWTDFEKVLKSRLPKLLLKYRETFFTKEQEKYLAQTEKEFREVAGKYQIPVWGFFAHG